MIDSRVVKEWSTPERAGRFRDLGLWGDATIADVFDAQVERAPGKLAIADGEVRWTYSELQDRSLRLAQVLLDLGLQPGEPVVAQLPSCALIPLLHLATNRIGVLMVPMATGWRRAEVHALTASVRAPMLISVPRDGEFDLEELHTQLRDDLPELREVRYFRDGADRLEDTIDATPQLTAERASALRPGAEEPGLVMVSSGSTGVPKASVWGNNDVITFLVHQTATALQLTPDDVAAGLAPASMGSTGYVFPVLTPLLVGASSVMLETWKPQLALDLITRERATYATAIPTQMIGLLELALEDHDLARFTRFNNAGAPLPLSVAEQIEERMGCRVQTIYGATDGGVPVMTSVSDPDHARRTSVGRVLVGEEIELRDAAGQPVAAGEVGEVCWRGANKSFGYLNQPDYDAEAFDSEGWFRSGDLGRFDDDGYLRIVGRTKDMILRGGVNIFPLEIEEALRGHPSVDTVAVVAVPDERLGERACAMVVPRGTPPVLQDLTEHLATCGLTKSKYPEFLVILEAMPLNQGGKVDRLELRKIAEASTTG